MGSYRILRLFRFVWPFTVMPGANCSIFGCSTSTRQSGISIFGLPKAEDELSRKTRQEWVNVITRNRVVNADLRHQIEEAECMYAKSISKKSLLKSVRIPITLKFT